MLEKFLLVLVLVPTVLNYDFYYKYRDYAGDEFFGYNPRSVCMVKVIDGYYYVSILDVYSKHKTCAENFTSSLGRRLLTCFHYRDQTHIAYRNDSEFIGLVSGKRQMLARDDPDAIVFDHFRSELYGLYGKQLYRLDMENLDKLQSSSIDLSVDSGEILDLMIVNKIIYIIMRTSFGNALIIRDESSRRSTETNMEQFKYILTDRAPFCMPKQTGTKAANLLQVMPEKPVFENGNFWLALLYAIDVLFIFLIIYFLIREKQANKIYENESFQKYIMDIHDESAINLKNQKGRSLQEPLRV